MVVNTVILTRILWIVLEYSKEFLASPTAMKTAMGPL